MSLNPNAKSFEFRPTAKPWTPGSFAPPPAPIAQPLQSSAPPPAPAPVPAPVAAPATVVAPAATPTPAVAPVAAPSPVLAVAAPVAISTPVVAAVEVTESPNEEEEIDESDPLWIATLKITNGNRAEALKLLEDPDALMIYPEIKKIMESEDLCEDGDTKPSAESSESWEQEADSLSTAKGANDASTEMQSQSRASKSVPDVDPDDAVEAEVEAVDGDPRDHMNLVFIGHVDAGKSTLSGSILYLMGKVDARTIERFEKEAKQRNRESWFLAFIMDTSEEERAKGKTVEVGRAPFETAVHRYTILDAPGHKNYVPNMISGAAQADIGILVISARRGEFETGFEKGGQTREHALLAKTLGVRFLVVVINKMDDSTVNWEQERFDECVNKLKPFLKSCGYAIKKDVRFLPISGLTGANILNEVSPELCPWWRELCAQGANNTTIPTLIGTLDAFTISDRSPDGPLRLPVLDRYVERGLVVMGKVESGTLRVNDEVGILPTRRKAVVESIYSGESKLKFALPGENVLIKFSLNMEDVQKGFVISSLVKGCPAVNEFDVQIALVDMVEHRPVFSSGYDCVMHIHTAEVEISCLQVISVTDKRGQSVNRRFAKQGEMCVARLRTPLTTCMESFERMPALGRITLRDEGRTIAIGKVMKLYRPKAN